MPVPSDNTICADARSMWATEQALVLLAPICREITPGQLQFTLAIYANIIRQTAFGADLPVMATCR